MAIKFDITGDNSNFLGALQGAENGVRNTAKTVEAAGGDIEGIFKRISTAAAGMFGAFSAQQLIKAVVQTRGEFQQLEVAFQTMLGSAQKAAVMVKDLQTLAATTPFDMKGVSEGAKQLMAYGVQADDVVDTMRRLGDVAAGLSLPLTDLAWLYGTTLTQGRMFTMDLRQFQARGIPMADELAKIFGVTKNEVAGLVTAGKVTSKEVTEALKNMTAEGSKFGGLMEAQSHTITGQISNIEDTIEMMFNDLGKSQEGVINDALSGVSTLVDHWQEVAKVVGTAITAYGLYKGVLMATIALERARTSLAYNKQVEILEMEIAATRQLLAAKDSEKNADLAAMVAKKQLTQAQAEEIAMKRQELEATKQQVAANKMQGGLDSQIAALQELGATTQVVIDKDLQEAVASNTITQAQAQEIQGKRELLAQLTQEAQARVNNLNAKAYEARMNLQNAQANQAEAQSAADAAQEKLQAAREAMDAAIQSGDADAQAAARTEIGLAINEVYTAQQNLKAASTEVATAQTAANTAVEAANTAQTELNTAMRAANAASTTTSTTSTATNTAATTANTVALRLQAIQAQAAAIAQGIFAAAVNSVKMAWNGLKVAMMTNPIGLILTGLTVAISLFTSFADSEDEATDANKRFGDSMDKATADVKGLYAVMETASVTSKAHKDAMDQLSQVAAEYGLKLDDEKDKTQQLIEKKQELIGLIKEEAIERQKANDIQSASDTYEQQIKDIKDEIRDDLSDALSEVQKNQLLNLISDDDIRELKQKYKEMSDAMAKSVKETGRWNSRFSTEQIQAYNDEVSKLTGRVGKYSEILHLNATETRKNQEAVKNQVTDMVKAASAHEQTKTEAEKAAEANRKAAEATDGMSDAQRLAAVQASYLRQTVDQLQSSIGQLLKNYANNNIHFTLTLDTTSVPDWMKKQLGINGKGGNQKEAQYRASFWASQLDWINKNPRNTGRMIQGKWYSKNDIATRAAQYAVANSTIKNDADAAAAAKPKKTKKGKTDNAAQRAENTKEENERWREEQLKQQREAQYALEEAEIASIRNSAERERRERKLQHQKDLDQLDDQKREFQRQNYEHDKKLFENSGKDKKNKFTGSVETTALTQDQQTQLDAQKKKIEAEWAQYREEQEKANLQSLYEYYQEYGSFEQKRLALTEEYAQKIADAENEGEKKRLEKERDQKLSSLSYEDISMGLDWNSLFSGIGSMTTEMMEVMQTKLKAFVKTDDYKNADSQTQRDVSELLSTMRQYLGSDQNVTWQSLTTAMNNFNAAIIKYENAQDAEREAIQTSIDAREAWQSGEISEDEYKKYAEAAKKAGDATANARKEVELLGNTLNETSDELAHHTSKLTASLNNLNAWNSLDGFSDVVTAIHGTETENGTKGGLDGLKADIDRVLPELSGNNKSFLEDLSKILENNDKKDKNGNATGILNIGTKLTDLMSSGVGSVISIVAQIPKIILQIASAIKNFVTGILDSFTELFKLRWIDDLVNSILGAISNLIDAIFDLPENLFHVIEAIVVKGVGGLLNTVVGRVGNILSFGALSSDGPASWFTNSNAKDVAKTTEQLTASNEALTKAVDDLKDSIDKSGGRSAVNSYQQAYKDQQAVNENTMDILRTQMGYHGSHHSNAYHWNLSSEDYAAINRTLAQYAAENPTSQTTRDNVYSLNDIYELTPEQMKAISSHNVEIWQKMLDQGKYDKSEYWENYIELAGQLEELTEKINENLTQTSFDTMKANFVSDIMDMEKTASDFSDDFTEMIAKAWANAVVNDLMAGDLKKFYEGWADKMKNGTLTKDDVDALKKEYEGLIDQALNIRDTMSDVTGYTGETNEEQNASANGMSEITYDQANQFIGLVTAGNIVRQNIADNLVNAVATITTLSVTIDNSSGTLSEIRNLMIYNNSYLDDILKFEKNIYNDFLEKIDQTNRYLKEMK